MKINDDSQQAATKVLGRVTFSGAFKQNMFEKVKRGYLGNVVTGCIKPQSIPINQQCSWGLML